MGALTVGEDRFGAVGLRSLGVETWAAAGLLAVLVFGFFLLRLGVTSETIRINNCILGADVETYFRGLSNENWAIFRIRKHALAVAAMAAIGWPLTLAGVPAATAALIALAAAITIGALAFFLFLRLLGLRVGAAFFIVLTTLSAFGSLTIFSVVESYGITFGAMAVAMLAFIVLARHSKSHPVLCATAAGIAGAAPGTANLPAVACVLLYAGLVRAYVFHNRSQRTAIAVAIPVAIAVGLSFVPMIYTDLTAAFEWQRYYVDRYASVDNFISLDVLSDYVLSFWVFAFVSPLDVVKYRYSSLDAIAVLGSALRLGGYLLVASALSFGALSALRRHHTRSITLSALLAVGSLFVFYLYFNPAEAVLYSSQWILLLAVASAPGYVAHRYAGPLFAACFLISSVVNYPPLDDPRSTDASSCCGPAGSTGQTAAPGEAGC